MNVDRGNLEIEIEVVTSRRALIDVIAGLAEHRDALTVLGGHAVIEITRDIPDLPPDDTTRDGDLGVTPQLLGEAPNLTTRMAELGFEAARPERPGVWSPIDQRDRESHDRDSVDLIAPMSLARGGIASGREIRSARVGDHGKHAVSAARGTELSVLDRRLLALRSFDDGPSVEAYVAGPAALLCAKAYKIHDRLDPSELRRNAERLRPKDFADLFRLTLAVAPEEASRVFGEGMEDPRIAEAVRLGRDHLLELLADSSLVAGMVADAWGEPSAEPEFRVAVDRWRARFAAVAAVG